MMPCSKILKNKKIRYHNDPQVGLSFEPLACEALTKAFWPLHFILQEITVISLHARCLKFKVSCGSSNLCSFIIIENNIIHFVDPLECLVSTKRSYIFKQTCSWKLKVCLTMCDLLVDTRHQRINYFTVQVLFKNKGDNEKTWNLH